MEDRDTEPATYWSKFGVAAREDARETGRLLSDVDADAGRLLKPVSCANDVILLPPPLPPLAMWDRVAKALVVGVTTSDCAAAARDDDDDRLRCGAAAMGAGFFL